MGWSASIGLRSMDDWPMFSIKIPIDRSLISIQLYDGDVDPVTLIDERDNG